MVRPRTPPIANLKYSWMKISFWENIEITKKAITTAATNITLLVSFKKCREYFRANVPRKKNR